MEFNKKHMSPLNSQKIRVNRINVFPKLCSRSVNRSRIRHDGFSERFPNPPGSSPVSSGSVRIKQELSDGETETDLHGHVSVTSVKDEEKPHRILLQLQIRP